jgi:hypothetical protein
MALEDVNEVLMQKRIHNLPEAQRKASEQGRKEKQTDDHPERTQDTKRS